MKTIQCKFCTSTKSTKYIFTICQHLVCLNCASLRSTQSLKCCNQFTILKWEVLQELRIKKDLIMNNLANQYQYDKTQVNELQQLKIKAQASNLRSVQQIHQQYQYNQYSNRKPLQIQCDLIKQLQIQPKNSDRQIFYTAPQQLSQQFSPIHRLPLQQTYEQSQKLLMLKQQFLPLIDNKIYQIREKFKNIRNQLEIKQANVIYQMKIYYEEYLKQLQNQDQAYLASGIIQHQTLNVYLNRIVAKWDIKAITNVIRFGSNTKQEKNYQEINSAINLQAKLNQQAMLNQQSNLIQQAMQQAILIKQAKQIQQAMQININSSGLNNRVQTIDFAQTAQTVFESPKPTKSTKSPNTRYSGQDENINIEIKPQTSRNLDKIYKKLQESRSKLEERMNRHNWFMTDRCNHMSKV